MTAHLSDDALVSLALGEGTAAERSHALSCEACARRVEEARGTLERVLQAEVPEPSPVYWEALRRGVSRRIAEDGHVARRSVIFVPLAAAAALLALLFAGQALPRKGPGEPGLAAWSALPVVEEDEGLHVLEGLALASGELAEWNGADGLGAYLANLTDEESQALAETLRQRGHGGGS